MTISVDADTITLSGTCGVEEVEALVQHLENNPRAKVDLNGATAVHTALWQALMIYTPGLAGLPQAQAVVAITRALRTFLDKSQST
jgi:hypothetical protein